MSLYNQLFGVNFLAGALLPMLELDPESVPRFRDCWWDRERGMIVLHTRTGGGNREAYGEQNDVLAAHPQYKSDEDDDYDSTFANFYFSLPEKWEHVRAELDALAGDPVTSRAKWEAALKAIEGRPTDPAAKVDGDRIRQAAESLAKKLNDAFNKPAGDGPNIIEV